MAVVVQNIATTALVRVSFCQISQGISEQLYAVVLFELNFNVFQSLRKEPAAYRLALTKKVCTFNIDPPWISAQVAFRLVFLEIAIQISILFSKS